MLQKKSSHAPLSLSKLPCLQLKHQPKSTRNQDFNFSLSKSKKSIFHSEYDKEEINSLANVKMFELGLNKFEDAHKLEGLMKKYKIKTKLNKAKLEQTTKSISRLDSINSSNPIITESSNTKYNDVKDALTHLETNKQIHQTCFRFENSEIDFNRSEIKNQIKRKLRQKEKMPQIVVNNMQKVKEESSGRKMLEIFVRNQISDQIFVPKENRNLLLNKEISFISSKVEQSMSRPGAKSQSALCTWLSKCYLVMGLSVMNSHDIWCGTMNKHRTGINWKREECAVLGDIPVLYGHTVVAFNHSLILYGGKSMEHKMSDRTFLFDTRTKEFTGKKCNFAVTAGCRRSHTAVLVGNHMFIHGGVDENDNVISRACFLDVVLMKWDSVQFCNGDLFLSQHCSAYTGKIDDDLGIFDKGMGGYRNLKFGRGIFFFGGIDEKGAFSNKLYFVALGKSELKFKEVKMKGNRPTPVRAAKIEYFEELNVLVIVGGMTAVESKGGMFVANLEKTNWIKVRLEGQIAKGFCGHQTYITKGNLVILGGMSNNQFAGSEVTSVSLSKCLSSSNGSKASQTFNQSRKRMLSN